MTLEAQQKWNFWYAWRCRFRYALTALGVACIGYYSLDEPRLLLLVVTVVSICLAWWFWDSATDPWDRESQRVAYAQAFVITAVITILSAIIVAIAFTNQLIESGTIFSGGIIVAVGVMVVIFGKELLLGISIALVGAGVVGLGVHNLVS